MARQNKDTKVSKFRLILVEDQTHKQLWTLRFTRVNFLVTSVTVLVCVTAIFFSIIAFTPVRTFIPGYPDSNAKRAAIQNAILADSLYEVAKYVTLDNHTTGMDTIVFNLDVWNSFSEEDQQMMLRAMDEATAYDREIWDASIEDAKAKLTAGGAIITTPAPEVQDSFFDAMAPLYEEYSVEYGDWIESINEVLGR